MTYHVERFQQTSHVLVFFRGHTLVDVVNIVVVWAVLLVLLLWIFNKDFLSNKYEIVIGHVTEIRRKNERKSGSSSSQIQEILRTILYSLALCWYPRRAMEAVCWFSVSFCPMFASFLLLGPGFSLLSECALAKFGDGSSCYIAAFYRRHSEGCCFRRSHAWVWGHSVLHWGVYSSCWAGPLFQRGYLRSDCKLPV